MLFDLRAGGRRRFVQVIYLMLAILLGGGLVLFGIGGEVSGGLFDAFREDSGTSNANQQFDDRIKQQADKLKTSPNDPAALATITKLRVQVAGAGENFNAEQGRFTAKGLAQLKLAEGTWDRYLKTEPEKVDTGAAIQMANTAYSGAGLNKPDKAVQAMELYIAARPESSNLYAQLASLAWVAGQNRKGDLAADKAVALAPEDDRKLTRERLDGAKSQVQAAAAQAAQAQAGAAGGAGGAAGLTPGG